jgi:hypothetical protein
MGLDYLNLVMLVVSAFYAGLCLSVLTHKSSSSPGSLQW